MVVNPFEIAASEEDEHWDGDFHDEGDGDSDDDDDDEEEEDYDGAGGLANGHNGNYQGNGNGSSPGRKKMKKMGMATHREYSGDAIVNLMYRSPRFVCFVGLVGCVIVVMVIASVVAKNKQNGLEAELENVECQVHTTQEPFSEWMHQIKMTNSSELCREEVPETDCFCHNPFETSYHEDTEGWHDVFDVNLKQLNETLKKGGTLDLVLYGDSHIERLSGRQFGQYPDELKGVAQTTEEIFTTRGGGKLDAYPLGIAGDEIHSLLYRLKNGEMPETLQPSAWWVMIGTNDIKADCDIDAVVAGVVTVVEEILRRDERYRQQDAAHVVINSLFPRVELYDDPLWQTIQAINSRLDCYAETTEGIEFFNATDLFVSDGAVDKNMFIPDQIHLSAQGVRAWEEAIVEKALYLKEHSS